MTDYPKLLTDKQLETLHNHTCQDLDCLVCDDLHTYETLRYAEDQSEADMYDLHTTAERLLKVW